ncbi:MAG: formyl transferase [Pseudomonadota bacterium]
MEQQCGSTDLVAITAGGPHAWITINALREAYGPFPVIQEEGEPAGVFWKRRLRKLGAIEVAGQWGAMVLAKLTKPLSKGRVPELVASEALKPEPDPDQEIIHVPSVNSDEARDALQRLSPKAVYVVSTRMIRSKTLGCVDAPFINYHSGINPAYRGINGGYFALARGEPEHFGTTLHLVDEGVDTGDVLKQVRIETTKADNLHTYMWLMAARSRQAVVEVMGEAIRGELKPYTVDLPSRQYYAPTLWFYLWAGLRRGAW